MISTKTLRIAHRALLEMEQGVRPWAELGPDQERDAPRVLAEIQAAKDEIRAEVVRRELFAEAREGAAVVGVAA